MTAGYQIDIQNEKGYAVDESRLREAIAATLERQGIAPGTALTVVFTDDREIRRLNRRHRNIDAPTDILSFPADAPPVAIPDEPPYLGDLVIAYPYAAAQAEREGQALGDSLALLVIHGALHLLGFDHHDAASRAEMWAAQEAILTRLGIPLDVLPALESESHDGPVEENR